MDTAQASLPFLSASRWLRSFPWLHIFLGVIAMNASAIEAVNFDSASPGTVPEGWIAGVTGKGTPKWSVERDASAPSAPNVLKQSGSGTYPWCVKKDAAIENGFVEVKFNALAGKEDQAGGVVWRLKDRKSTRLNSSHIQKSRMPSSA